MANATEVSFWSCVLGSDDLEKSLTDVIADDLARNFSYDDIENFAQFDERVADNFDEMLSDGYMEMTYDVTMPDLLHAIGRFGYYSWEDNGPFYGIYDVVYSAILNFYWDHEEEIKHKVCQILGVQE